MSFLLETSESQIFIWWVVGGGVGREECLVFPVPSSYFSSSCFALNAKIFEYVVCAQLYTISHPLPLLLPPLTPTPSPSSLWTEAFVNIGSSGGRIQPQNLPLPHSGLCSEPGITTGTPGCLLSGITSNQYPRGWHTCVVDESNPTVSVNSYFP